MKRARWASAPYFVVLLTLGASALGTGCDADSSHEARFARRLLPPGNPWHPESEIPKEPQASPSMVIWEVSRFAPETPPTSQQQQAAHDLIARSYAAAEANGWFDFEKGRADGFVLLSDDNRHYVNEEFMIDDRVLDPERPEFLMYYPTREGKVLTGFMFMLQSPEERGPQIGGPLTVWHYHVWSRLRCFYNGIQRPGFLRPGGNCPGGETGYRSPEMLHVWLLDHPDGPFDSWMYFDPTELEDRLAKRKQERGY